MIDAPTKARLLPFLKLDPNSPVPLYHQIEQDLRQMMAVGILAPGDALPPETDMAEQYGVGRHTMRMALSRLVAGGLLARRAGRGTVVRSQPDRRHFYLDRSFTRQMEEMGMQARSKVISTSADTLELNLPDPLGKHAGAACFKVERLRYGDETPIGLQTTTILTALCPDIEQFDFMTHSLYDVLSNHYHLIVTRITHTVGAVLAERDQAKLLDIHPRDPLLLVKTSAYLENDDLIEFTTSYYRADQYEYRTTHTYPS
jgi:GntR family transcriptional regulator